MTDPAPGDVVPAHASSTPKEKKPWKARTAGRLCLIFSLLFTCLYGRDVPRAFDYMITGVLPPKLNVLWLEYSVRDFYLPGRFALKVLRGALPGGAIGFSVLLLVLGCVVSRAPDRANVRSAEASLWTALGAFLVGVNGMASWIMWKAFVFL